MNNTSRRDFLKLAGKGLVGAAALSTMPAAMALADGTEAPAYPWEWHPIDKDVVRAAAYEAYYNQGGCCAGGCAGIIDVLAAEYGYPYNQIPGKMFAYGGGGYGAGTLCGALGGVCAVIGLFCEPKEARAIRDELYAWYREEPFPKYQPEMDSATSVAHSILCADSVGTYLATTGYANGSDEQRKRCAGLTADVAAKAVELLNIHFGFEEAAPAPEAAEAVIADNEFVGEATSEIGGPLKVKVTMNGDKIEAVEVIEHGETVGISDPAIAQIPEKIVAAQSADVDAVAGATKTSEAIIAAVKDALAKAGK